jgi:hypothetical protein
MLLVFRFFSLVDPTVDKEAVPPRNRILKNIKKVDTIGIGDQHRSTALLLLNNKRLFE